MSVDKETMRAMKECVEFIKKPINVDDIVFDDTYRCDYCGKFFRYYAQSFNAETPAEVELHVRNCSNERKVT